MDFSFSEEQQEVQNLARSILEGEATTDRLAEVEKGDLRYDAELWAKLAEAGLLGTSIEEAYGGMNFGFTEMAFFIEEVGRTVAPVPVVPVIVSAALPIQKFATEEQKQRLLPAVVSGEKLITAALMEELNENPANALTTAVADGDGFKLCGKKLCVPFAEQAERILLTAKTEKGLGVFLLDPKADGVTLNSLWTTNHEPQYELVMDGAKVEAADVVTLDKAEALVKYQLEHSQVAYAAMQVGVTEKMMRMTAQYTTERHQFGVPIATFQAVGHRQADCYIDIECLRLTTYQAISMLDADQEASNEVTIAKIWAGDTGHRVSYAAQHLHGGMGVDKDYFLWRYCLWARQIEMTLGTSAALLSQLGETIAAGNAYACRD